MNFIDLTRGKYPHLYVPSWLDNYNFKNVISICHDFQDLFSVNGKRVDVEDILQTIPIFLVESSMSGEYFPVPGAECLIKVPLDRTYGLVEDFDIDEWVNSKEDGHKDDPRERRSVRSEIFDFLGVYVSMEEGTLIPRRIFVWMDKIQEYAKMNTDKPFQFNGDVNRNASALFDLVVCHELAHALMDVDLYGVRPSPNFTYTGDYVYRFIEEAYANAVALKVLYDAFGEVQKRFVEKFVENQGPGYSEGLRLWESCCLGLVSQWMAMKVLFDYDLARLIREFWRGKDFNKLTSLKSVGHSQWVAGKTPLNKQMSMTPKEKRIAWEIINCGLLNAPNPGCVCHSLYDSQHVASIQDFQIPEPWNGDIVNAPILFLGINPGFTSDELYPKTGDPYWTRTPGVLDATKVENFFECRFNGVYVTHSNGHKFSIKTISQQFRELKGRTFWGYIKSIADKILNTRTTRPGIDFAITEIVHCKSKNIACISPRCYDMCIKKHFNGILSLAQNLQYIVIVGHQARVRISKHFGIASPVCKYQWYKLILNNRPVKIIFVDHNAGGGSPKKVPLP